MAPSGTNVLILLYFLGATRTQRGLRERGMKYDLDASGRDIYAFPRLLTRLIDALPALRALPIIPKEKKLRTARVHASDASTRLPPPSHL